MSVTNLRNLGLSAFSATLSTLAIVHITSRQQLVLEKWLPSMHWLAVVVLELARQRWASGTFSRASRGNDAPTSIGWDIIMGALLATQHTLELWCAHYLLLFSAGLKFRDRSFLKLPSTMAIMVPLLPLNLGLLSFCSPLAAKASTAPSARISVALLLLLTGLGVVSGGKQDRMCVLFALGAVAMGAIINRLSGMRSSVPYSLTSMMIACVVSIGFALTLGGPVMGHKLYIPFPLAPAIVASGLFAIWFTFTQGGRAIFSVSGPIVQPPSVRGVLLTQSLPAIVAAFCAIFVLLLSGSYVDIHMHEDRGQALLLLTLLAAAIAFVLYMIPRVDDETYSDEGYELAPGMCDLPAHLSQH